ncbi:hypothetical protein [Leptotrichia sp. oral taxon 879]|uniref:hypothetical protein n=1 Tax=Leptotrichia sp. oral taxon 879 TaxID=1227267 RepID=UPI0003AE2A7D|nr:hypothetical protein [Leptotrichia sp. oral taxon 879]ERK52122.1 hypothetical protein HMPREF1552_00845 [Leptotrichia sp. oral taxon 879 str. F0557]
MKILGKLIKYDFADIGKLIFPFYIGLGIMGICIRILLFVLMNKSIDQNLRFTVTLFQGTLYFVYTLAVIGSIIMLHYGVVVRFYRSVYGNEGYLTNTLPISTAQIILAKTITFLSWFIINGFIIFLTFLLIIPLEEIVLSKFWENPDFIQMINYLKTALDIQYIIPTIILFIIFLIFWAIEKILFLFFCVSVANMAKSYRILIGAALFMIIGGILNVIKRMILVYTYLYNSSLYDKTGNVALNVVKYIISANFGLIILTGIVSIVLFLSVNYILKNKLNLE